jgi:hypothetical protein
MVYANQSNNKTETKYNSYERECLAIVLEISSFKCYLYGSPFTFVTDHQPLKLFMESN